MSKNSVQNLNEEAAPRPPTPKRMSVNLSGDAARLLEYLAQEQGISQNEALRKAIATEAYFYDERLNGSKVLLQKPDKEIREVLFR
jgi:hypothetical protein